MSDVKLKVEQVWTPNDDRKYFTKGQGYEIIKDLGDGDFYIEDDDKPHPHSVDERWINDNFTLLPQKEVESGLSDGVDWIHGSEYYKPSTQEFFRMPRDNGVYAEYYSQGAQDWKINASVPVSNLTRSYFIKRVEWPSCDSQENINPGVEGEAFDALFDEIKLPLVNWDGKQSFDFGMAYIDGGGTKCEFLGLHAGIVIGRPVIELGLAMHNKYYLSTSVGPLCKPIQTAEDKLRNHLFDSINCEAKDGNLTDVIIHDLMNSDEFTIKLNED